MQYEIEENYEESVSCYRNAVGTMLQSVQKDRCLKRQASVKRRISQYIGKAEALIQVIYVTERSRSWSGMLDFVEDLSKGVVSH